MNGKESNEGNLFTHSSPSITISINLSRNHFRRVWVSKELGLRPFDEVQHKLQYVTLKTIRIFKISK